MLGSIIEPNNWLKYALDGLHGVVVTIIAFAEVISKQET